MARCLISCTMTATSEDDVPPGVDCRDDEPGREGEEGPVGQPDKDLDSVNTQKAADQSHDYCVDGHPRHENCIRQRGGKELEMSTEFLITSHEASDERTRKLGREEREDEQRKISRNTHRNMEMWRDT